MADNVLFDVKLENTDTDEAQFKNLFPDEDTQPIIEIYTEPHAELDANTLAEVDMGWSLLRNALSEDLPPVGYVERPLPSPVQPSPVQPSSVPHSPVQPQRRVENPKKKTCTVCKRGVCRSNWARHLRSNAHKKRATANAIQEIGATTLSPSPPVTSTPTNDNQATSSSGSIPGLLNTYAWQNGTVLLETAVWRADLLARQRRVLGGFADYFQKRNEQDQKIVAALQEHLEESATKDFNVMEDDLKKIWDHTAASIRNLLP